MTDRKADLGAIVLIAVCCGYFALLVGLACLWLFGLAGKKRAEVGVGSLIGRLGPAKVPDDGGRRRPPEDSIGPPLLNCSFCGKTQNQVAKLIAGPGVYVCDECVALCQDIMRESVPKSWDDRPHPRDVVAALDRAVAGHRHAKSALAVAVWRHAGCCRDHWCQGHELRFDVLIAGADPVTRRRLAEATAGAFEIPFIALDAAEILSAGGRPAALKAVFDAVYKRDWEREALPQSMLFVDNMDRIGAWPAAGSFQRTLVGIVGGRQSPAWELWGAPVRNSSHVQLVCGGDFAGIERSRHSGRGGLEQFGIGQFLVDRLPCVAILDSAREP